MLAAGAHSSSRSPSLATTNIRHGANYSAAANKTSRGGDCALAETGFDAPKLKTVYFDRTFDSKPRKIVGRRFVGFDDAFGMPRLKTGGQFAALRVTGECTEFTHFRLENINPHRWELTFWWVGGRAGPVRACRERPDSSGGPRSRHRR